MVTLESAQFALEQQTPSLPDHAARFRCIGPACEDSCCSGWSVFFDRPAVERYAQLPPGPLRVLIETQVTPLPPSRNGGADRGAEGVGPAQFARVQLTPEHACPFWTADKLCRIQVEHGPDFLADTCAAYPRMRHRIGAVEETVLTLSCPEAARLVLLAPPLPESPPFSLAGSEGQLECGVPGLAAFFWPIRRLVLWLATARAYPLWQRLFLLGVFARRLQAAAGGELDRDVPALLRDFAAAVQSGSLRAAMEALPADFHAQLDAVLRLAGIPLPRSHIGLRFRETVAAFTQGIGNRPGATMASLVAGYSEAHDRWFAPFFRRHPEMLENLLAHTLQRTLFPFGSKPGARSEPNPAPEPEREFALLAGQFALMRGLLIGVAGRYREEFDAEHAVRTVQSTAKHFEHHPGFPDAVYGVLTDPMPASVRSLALLLRP